MQLFEALIQLVIILEGDPKLHFSLVIVLALNESY